jgi:hypothetical protein
LFVSSIFLATENLPTFFIIRIITYCITISVEILKLNNHLV